VEEERFFLRTIVVFTKRRRGGREGGREGRVVGGK